TDLFIKDIKNNGKVTPIVEGKNFQYQVEVHDGQMYILTNEDAPRYRLMKVAADAPARENWKELIQQSDKVLDDMQFTGGKLMAKYQHIGASSLDLYSLGGQKLGAVSLPTIGDVTGLGGSKESGTAFFGFNSYTTPPAVYSYDLASKKT